MQRGPFAGMHYGTAGGWDLASKLIGSYEAELHQELERLIASGYDRVINVGCAEGYYAVGLGLRLPEAEIWAFDIDDRSQALCRRLAAENGVGHRVHVDGLCTPRHLGSLIVGRTLLVVDIEGAELSLLDPVATPELTEADLIVEFHDFIDPSISATLTRRFAATHTCKLVNSVPRDPGHYDELRSLPWRDQVDAVDERRPGVMQWSILQSTKTTIPTTNQPHAD